MSLVGRVTQQPNDALDYDIDFGQWFPPGDEVVSATVRAVPAMPIPPTTAIQHPRVKVWVYEGGLDGVTYQLTVLATTNDGRKKEVELRVRIKEI